MCGIYGLLSTKPFFYKSEAGHSILKILRNGLLHRGPDANNSFTPDPYCYLGHTRLSINDIENGSQPFIHNQQLASVINGEIYNYHDLVSKYVGGSSTHPRTSSDCEIVGYLYQQTQDPSFLLSALRGMFAGSIYDSKTNSLTLLRDHFGEKPLYFLNTPSLLIFSSEIKPLLRATSSDLSSLSPSFVSEYFLFGYPVSLPESTSRIQAILPGSAYSFQLNYNSIKCYKWRTPKSSYQSKNYKDLALDYVTKSTISDVPLAIGLSGGKDSAFVASSLKDKISQTFTVGYESDGGSNEVEEAASIANYLSLPHTPLLIKDDEVSSLFVKQAQFRDLPGADIAGIGYFKLYEAIHNAGFKVALMGHGGDELYIGYEWLYNAYLLNSKFYPSSSFLFETLPDHRVYLKYLNNILHESYSYEHWSTYRPSTDHTYLSELENSPHSHTLSLISQYWLEPNSLRMGDSLSMACSVEARHPLLSYDVASLIAQRDIHDRLSAPKVDISNLLSEMLPDKLLQKKKKYFSPPFMKFYSLIHRDLAKYLQSESKLLDLNLVSPKIYNQLFGTTFNPDSLTYYYFFKFASLEYWLRSL